MGIFGRLWGDDADYEEDNDLGLEESMPRSKKREADEPVAEAPRKGNKVVNINATAQLQVVLVKP